MAIEHLPVSVHSEYEMCHTKVYLKGFAIGFI
jgi:hypothetical protein